MFKLLRLPDYLFVWITSFFIAGIGSAELSDLHLDFFFLGGAVVFLVSLFFFNARYSSLGKIWIASCFFLLGWIYGEEDESSNLIKGIAVVEGDVVQWKKGRGDWDQVLLAVEKYWVDKQQVPKEMKVLVYCKNSSLRINEGVRLRLKADFTFIEAPKYPGAFDSKTYWGKKGVYHLAFVHQSQVKIINENETGLTHVLTKMRQFSLGLFDRYLGEKESALMKALVLGDKQGMEQEVKQDFSKAGAMHILAVSGLHVGILFALLLYVFSLFPRIFSRYLAFALALVILVLYAFLTGGSASILRAVFMFGLLGLGKVMARPYKSVNLLFFSALILILLNRDSLYDLGFQLSYLAVLGILLFYPWISSLWYFPNKVLRKLWEGTAIGIAATLFTFPLTIYTFHIFPSYFVLTNLLLMFLTEILLVSGILFLVLGAIGLSLTWFGFFLKYLVAFFLYLVNFIADLPGSTASGFVLSWEQMLCFFLLLLCFIWASRKASRKGMFVASFVFVFLLIWVQKERWDQLRKREIIIFPTSKPFLLIKDKDFSYCLYADSTQIGKYHKMLTGFEKLYPSRLLWHYIPMNSQINLEWYASQIRIEQNQNGIRMELDDTCYFLPKYEYGLNSDGDGCQLVRASWMSKMPNSISLKEGAFIIPLKKVQAR